VLTDCNGIAHKAQNLKDEQLIGKMGMSSINRYLYLCAALATNSGSARHVVATQV
jgi:hypothetical protein